MLTTTSELESTLENQNLIIIDTRSFRDYSEGHIPGAINLDLFAFHWIDTSTKGIKNFQSQTETLFSFVGVTPQKKVVFYDDVSGMLSARGVWMLMYYSHPNASMLDGGFTKWKEENRLIETKTNLFKPSKFLGKINSDIIVGYEEIKDNLDSFTIIDARSADEYDGSVIRAARAGHIPNAINIDWKQNLTNNGTFKKHDELLKLYQLPKDTRIVTYCQGAYRASNTFLVLKKLGFSNVSVYLGSWGEWGNRPDLPVEK